MRQKIGASILNAIKIKEKLGCTSTEITTLVDEDLYWVQSMIAEVSAIWGLDLCRAEDKREKVLKHQEDLLTGKKGFKEIFTPGVYLGMTAQGLRS